MTKDLALEDMMDFELRDEIRRLRKRLAELESRQPADPQPVSGIEVTDLGAQWASPALQNLLPTEVAYRTYAHVSRATVPPIGYGASYVSPHTSGLGTTAHVTATDAVGLGTTAHADSWVDVLERDRD